MGMEDARTEYLEGFMYSHMAKSPLTVWEEFWGGRWSSDRGGISGESLIFSLYYNNTAKALA